MAIGNGNSAAVECDALKARLKQHWPAAALLTLFALLRWPDLLKLPNFSMAYALVFCAAAFPRRLPWWLVLGVMVGTDLALNRFHYRTESLFSDYQAVNYLAYAGIFLLGRCFDPRAHPGKLIGGGVLGALIFYLVTNTAAWLQNPEYAKTLGDWIRALTTGTTGWPETWTFLRNTLLGGGLFTALIASTLQATEAEAPEPEEAEESAPEGEPAKEEQKA